MKRLAACLTLGALACAIPDVGSVDLSGCIRGCNETTSDCFADASWLPCEEADSCDATFDACSSELDVCLEGCAGTEGDGCYSECQDVGTGCLETIGECIELRTECVIGEANAKQGCLTGLVECVAVCVDELEAEF